MGQKLSKSEIPLFLMKNKEAVDIPLKKYIRLENVIKRKDEFIDFKLLFITRRGTPEYMRTGE